MCELKTYRGVMCYDNVEWCKISNRIDLQRSYVSLHSRLIQSLKKNWLVLPKIDMRNLASLHQSTCLESLWIRTLMTSFCLKMKMYELKIYRGVVSWQWRMMQKLKRNGLVSSKLTWVVLKISTRALENLKNVHFNGLFLTKVHVWAKKSIEELFLMALNINAKFEGEMTCAFKNDMRNLANFHQNMFKNLKIGTLMGSFYPK